MLLQCSEASAEELTAVGQLVADLGSVGVAVRAADRALSRNAKAAAGSLPDLGGTGCEMVCC